MLTTFVRRCSFAEVVDTSGELRELTLVLRKRIYVLLIALGSTKEYIALAFGFPLTKSEIRLTYGYQWKRRLGEPMLEITCRFPFLAIWKQREEVNRC